MLKVCWPDSPKVLSSSCVTGHKVDFRNTIIVLTSNLGADILVRDETPEAGHAASEGGDVSASTKQAVMDVVAASYPPEFLNRIDEFIIFKRLSKRALRDIVDIRLRELQERLVDRRIQLSVSEDVKEWLCQKGYDPRYGARPLNRLISRKVGNKLADQLIRGAIKPGDVVQISLTPEDDLRVEVADA